MRAHTYTHSHTCVRCIRTYANIHTHIPFWFALFIRYYVRTRQSTYVGAYKCERYSAVGLSRFLRLLRRVADDKNKKDCSTRNKQAGTPALVLPFPYIPVTFSVKRARIWKAAVTYISPFGPACNDALPLAPLTHLSCIEYYWLSFVSE